MVSLKDNEVELKSKGYFWNNFWSMGFSIFDEVVVKMGYGMGWMDYMEIVCISEFITKIIILHWWYILGIIVLVQVWFFDKRKFDSFTVFQGIDRLPGKPGVDPSGTHTYSMSGEGDITSNPGFVSFLLKTNMVLFGILDSSPRKPGVDPLGTHTYSMSGEGDITSNPGFVSLLLKTNVFIICILDSSPGSWIERALWLMFELVAIVDDYWKTICEDFCKRCDGFIVAYLWNTPRLWDWIWCWIGWKT
ncbi:hypothetical protein LXL04_026040 [Taraxacum kok-saghyz]